jgi:tRNA threonylcarbamoyladenosine biosynthesis protein TsaE
MGSVSESSLCKFTQLFCRACTPNRNIFATIIQMSGMEFRFSKDELAVTAQKILDVCAGTRVFALEGPMGAGKTTFVHALCDEWGVKDVVGSPTFSIINEYKTSGGDTVYHMDLYRLKDEEELIAAGVEDALYSGAVCLVEWPEKADTILPSDTVYLTLVPLGEKERLLKIRFPH